VQLKGADVGSINHNTKFTIEGCIFSWAGFALLQLLGCQHGFNIMDSKKIWKIIITSA
jgi:hypothetical protein